MLFNIVYLRQFSKMLPDSKQQELDSLLNEYASKFPHKFYLPLDLFSHKFQGFKAHLYAKNPKHGIRLKVFKNNISVSIFKKNSELRWKGDVSKLPKEVKDLLECVMTDHYEELKDWQSKRNREPYDLLLYHLLKECQKGE